MQPLKNTHEWINEPSNQDASPLLKLAFVLIAIFCSATMAMGGQMSSGMIYGAAALSIFYVVGVVAFSLRTYRR